MKIAVNRCFGGFGLSRSAIKAYLTLEGKECHVYTQTAYKHREGFDRYEKVAAGDDDSFISYYFTKDFGPSIDALPEEDKFQFWEHDLNRTDESLIKVIEELGKEANGRYADLQVVEIPDDIEWHIDEYDGIESIHENHRSW